MNKEADRRSEEIFRLLERMLNHTRKRNDNASLVATLRDRYASGFAFLSSNAHLMECCGVHRHDALLFSRTLDLARQIDRDSFVKSPQLGRLALASEYLRANSFGLKVERFYMLCLDAKGRLMERVFLQEGTLDGMLFNLRGLLAEVVRVSPCAIVLSHNHPGCTLRPSNEDINCTCAAIRALTAVGIPLLDHIIVAGKQAVSMRENGFIPAVQWLQQAPENQLLRCWLDGQASSKK